MAQGVIISETSNTNYLDGLLDQPSIAIVIPCCNEELTIADVVAQFRKQLPTAQIYVFDNNSTDQTAANARLAGAHVFKERRQGKGYVVQSMFRRIDADVYVLADGDGELPAPMVQTLLAPILKDEADMVVGSRFHQQSHSQFRSLNRLGNGLVVTVLNTIFKVKLTDVLSGYRAFNRRFVKGIPLFGGGFEIETELTIKAIERGYRIVEVPIDSGQRPPGSLSKVHFVRDGLIVLNTMLALFRDYQPLTFFGLVGLFLIGAGLIPGLLVILEVIGNSLVLRLAVIACAVVFILAGMFSVTVGLILHTIARRSQELEYQLQVLTHGFSDRQSGTQDRSSEEPIRD